MGGLRRCAILRPIRPIEPKHETSMMIIGTEISTLGFFLTITLFVFPPVVGVQLGTIAGIAHPRSTIAAGFMVGLVSGTAWCAGWWAYLWWEPDIADFFGYDFFPIVWWLQASYAVLTAFSSVLCVWAFARWGGGPWHEREDGEPRNG